MPVSPFFHLPAFFFLVWAVTFYCSQAPFILYSLSSHSYSHFGFSFSNRKSKRMEGIHVLSYTLWSPLKKFGLTDIVWSLNQETIIGTWVCLGILLALIIATRLTIQNQYVRFIATSFIRYFIDLYKQTLSDFNFNHFAFVTSLFIFILICNIISVFIPWVEEPTSDINTPLALGIASFLYVQAATVQSHGVGGYLKEYITPFAIMAPLHMTGKLATIISISFRLFGNIFGGMIITQIYNSVKMGSLLIETLLLVSGMNLLVTLFFGLFEGLIQAFVFFMLTLTYLAIGIQHEEGEEYETI